MVVVVRLLQTNLLLIDNLETVVTIPKHLFIQLFQAEVILVVVVAVVLLLVITLITQELIIIHHQLGVKDMEEDL